MTTIIVEASELGSGFQIAMRDLEIRGAGEILGASQSGNMQTVGVSHYLRILKNAVEELKSGGKAEEEVTTTEIILPFEALLPSFYIPDEQEKINVYQKLAGSEDEPMLKEFTSELIDEFGPLPKQAENLLEVLTLKMACRRAGVLRVKMDTVSAKQRDIVLTLAPRVTADEIMQLLKKCAQWRISGTTLRINEAAFERVAGTKEWLPELTAQISTLIRPKKAKKKEDTVA
jgi:transcription-repair coupling factor (superfamily II helicase)